MDELATRMKMYEKIEAGRKLMPLLPAMVRIDGKCFSKFTKGLTTPFDERLSALMIFTTKALVEEYNALLGYTQSDEISLVFYSDSLKSQLPYDGKIQKMVGDMAAYASLAFNRALPAYLPEKEESMPRFDCRVWNVPNKVEAANTILWREIDATKNSVSMAARKYFSHKRLHGLGMSITKIMKKLQEKQYKVIRVSKTEFEIDNGDIYPIPFELDKVPTVKQFQKMLDDSKDLMLEILKKNG
jgi:tRNA(His) guanylyltransferase